jgi:acyl dehydratase
VSIEPQTAPKVWQGRFYEDFEPGDTFRSRFGRTVSEYDNLLFTCLTHNTNSIHFDRAHAERTQFGQILVNSTFTLALITGLTVPDTRSASRTRTRTSASSRCAAAASTSASRS